MTYSRAVTSHPPISIRRATPEDAVAILDCLGTSFEPYREQYTPDAFADTVLSRETIGQRLAAMAVLVATTGDGEVIGTIACNVVGGGEGHIRGMAVLPNWQGRGVSEQLLAAAEAELRRSGCSWVSLDTTRYLGRAIRFYEAHGYRRTDKVGDFFGMEVLEYT
ncbi:MAG: GNAT family N-acetyltransferase, partial [Acidobacteria bacterium]